MPRNVTREHPLIDPAAAWDVSPPVAPEAEPEPAAVIDPLSVPLDADAVPEEVPPGPVLDYGTDDGRPATLPVPVISQPVRPVVAREMGAVAQEACSNGHPLFHGAKFCPECGTPAGVCAEPQPWMCPGGHQNEASAKFCPECGSAYGAPQPPITGAGMAVELAAQVQPPRPVEMLSPAERAERERLHAEAVRAGAQMPPLQFEQPQGQTETIHMLEDGLTAFGVVWMRGQEITLTVGSERWNQARSWWNMPEFEQVERYGQIKFRKGPWPGKRYADAAGGFEVLGDLDREKAKQGARVAGPGVDLLVQADQREAQRRGAVPAPMWR